MRFRKALFLLEMMKKNEVVWMSCGSRRHPADPNHSIGCRYDITSPVVSKHLLPVLSGLPFALRDQCFRPCLVVNMAVQRALN